MADGFDPVLHGTISVAELAGRPRQDRRPNAAATIMSHHNHVADAQHGDGVRQNAYGVDVVRDEPIGDVTLGKERSRWRIENSTFGHAGVTR